MYRKAFFAMVMVYGLCSVAYANPTISLGNWTILFTSGQSIDLSTGDPIAVMIETPGGPPDDQFAAVDLLLTVNDGFTGPVIESIALIGFDTVFVGNNTGQADIFSLPTREAFSLTSTVAGTVNAGDGLGGPAVLAFLSFDATGVAPGTYRILLTNLVVGAPTDVFDALGVSLSPTLKDGSFTMSPASADIASMFGMITVITPEPASIVLALFAAGGFGALAIRRHRKCGRPKR